MGANYLKVLLGYNLLQGAQPLLTLNQLAPQPPGPPLQSLGE